MIVMYFRCFFFFSSRRRHTRCYRDWSSDVCSSDLAVAWMRRWHRLLDHRVPGKRSGYGGEQVEGDRGECPTPAHVHERGPERLEVRLPPAKQDKQREAARKKEQHSEPRTP